MAPKKVTKTSDNTEVSSNKTKKVVESQVPIAEVQPETKKVKSKAAKAEEHAPQIEEKPKTKSKAAKAEEPAPQIEEKPKAKSNFCPWFEAL